MGRHGGSEESETKLKIMCKENPSYRGIDKCQLKFLLSKFKEAASEYHY